MNQIHEAQMLAIGLDIKLQVGNFYPTIGGHWSGGAPGEGGVWHDGSKGGTVNKVTSVGAGMAQCKDLKPDGTPCTEIQPVEILK